MQALLEWQRLLNFSFVLTCSAFRSFVIALCSMYIYVHVAVTGYLHVYTCIVDVFTPPGFLT